MSPKEELDTWQMEWNLLLLQLVLQVWAREEQTGTWHIKEEGLLFRFLFCINQTQFLRLITLTEVA